MKRKTMREILKEARQLLKSGWVKGEWVRFPDVGVWSKGDPWKDLQLLIQEAKEKQANPKCQVCAEGAVYLACSLAGDEDHYRAEEIIQTLDSYTPLGSVMGVNDQTGTKLDDVDAVFALAEEAASG